MILWFYLSLVKFWLFQVEYKEQLDSVWLVVHQVAAVVVVLHTLVWFIPPGLAWDQEFCSGPMNGDL